MCKLCHRCFSTAVFWSFVTTALRFGGVLLVLPVVLRTIPQKQLGLYYVFQTLGVFAVLLDMGFAPSLARSVSYLWAGAPTLEVSGHSHAEGMAKPNWTLLKSVMETFRLFYWAASGLLLLILLSIGLPYIWHVTATLDNPLEGRSIWIVLSLGAVWNFAGTIWPTMLSGINRVRDQQVVQLIAISFGYAVTVSGLLLGFGLWAMAASMIVQATIQRQCSYHIFQRVVGEHFKQSHGKRDWDIVKTLWPSSWKTGIIGVAVTCYLSAPVFLTSTLLGLKEAGQVGLSMQLGMTVCQVAAVAMVVKAPMFSILRVNGRIKDLRRLFGVRIAVYVFLFLAGSAVLLIAGDWLLHTVIHSRTQFPSPVILKLVLLFVGVEGFQALFRGLALSANITGFWTWMLVGGTCSVAGAAIAISLGVVPFFVILVLAKFLLLDLSVIFAGMQCLYPKSLHEST